MQSNQNLYLKSDYKLQKAVVVVVVAAVVPVVVVAAAVVESVEKAQKRVMQVHLLSVI